MTNHFVDIIIPSFNSPHYLYPCLQSIFMNKATHGLFRVIVVNNGHKDSVRKIVEAEHKEITLIQAEKNLGWEGGLKLGLDHSKAPFVIFMNDDTFIPHSSRFWVNQLLRHFVHPDCAAAGPSSNFVCGYQNMSIFRNEHYFAVPFLIGFCVMLRRSHLDEVGGIDDSLPNHGDDIDLSIRLRKAGKFLVADKDAFVYHYGTVTGKREYGGYWNSTGMIEKTYHSLFRKHGVREVYDTFINPKIWSIDPITYSKEDSEGDLIRSFVQGDSILELACGGQKTVRNSIGIDLIPSGEMIPGLVSTQSQADVVGDVEKALPFEKHHFDTIIARHILEHVLDPIGTIANWSEVLKPNGKLIIAVPDNSKHDTIPLNFQHLHAFTPNSLVRIMEMLGWKIDVVKDSGNGVSFVGIFHRNGVHA